MTLKLKAYKCAFPELFDYSNNLWGDDNQYQIIYGENQRDAVKKRCNNDEFYTYRELKPFIRTRRYPEQDLYVNEPSPAIKSLTEKHIDHLTHSLGVRIGDICPKQFYRNYSLYHSKDWDCEHLVNLGLMGFWRNSDDLYYYVTERGIEAVKTLLLTTNNLITPE
jgi:hypothetical protein